MINFIMCMSPLIASVLSQVEFVEADIAYNEINEYLFNHVAFNNVTVEWMVVSRVRIDCQGADPYNYMHLLFEKHLIHEKCRLFHISIDFQPGKKTHRYCTRIYWIDLMLRSVG